MAGVEERTFLSPERPNHAGVKVGACQKKGAVRLAWDVESGDALALQGAGEDRPVKLAGKAGEQVRCPEALRETRWCAPSAAGRWPRPGNPGRKNIAPRPFLRK